MKLIMKLISGFVVFIFLLQNIILDIPYVIADTHCGGYKNLAPEHNPGDFDFLTIIAKTIQIFEGISARDELTKLQELRAIISGILPSAYNRNNASILCDKDSRTAILFLDAIEKPSPIYCFRLSGEGSNPFKGESPSVQYKISRTIIEVYPYTVRTKKILEDLIDGGAIVIKPVLLMGALGEFGNPELLKDMLIQSEQDGNIVFAEFLLDVLSLLIEDGALKDVSSLDSLEQYVRTPALRARILEILGRIKREDGAILQLGEHGAAWGEFNRKRTRGGYKMLSKINKDLDDKVRQVARNNRVSLKGVNIYGIQSIVKARNDFLYGYSTRTEEDGLREVWLAVDLMKKFMVYDGKNETRLLDEYIEHEIRCKQSNHQDLRKEQKRKYRRYGNYSDSSDEGRLRDVIRGDIDGRVGIARESKDVSDIGAIRNKILEKLSHLQDIHLADLRGTRMTLREIIKETIGEEVVQRRDKEKVRDILERMKRGEQIIPNELARDIVIRTEFGIIDLSKLNNVRLYEGDGIQAQIGRDLELAHCLGLITIDSGVGWNSIYVGWNSIYNVFKNIFGKKMRVIATSWSDYFMVIHYLEELIHRGLIKDYQDDAGQIRFYEEAFGDKVNDKHLGLLHTIFSKEMKRDILKNWNRMSLNYKDVKMLWEEIEDLVNDRGRWQGRRDTMIADDTGQVDFYKEIFGEEEVKGKHLGCLYGTIPMRYRGEGNVLERWNNLPLNYKDLQKLWKEIEDLVNDRGRWQGRRDAIIADNTGQVEFYRDIFGEEEVKGKYLGGLYRAIPIRYRGEGNILEGWNNLLVNYEDLLKLWKEIEDLVNDRGRWQGRRDTIIADNTGQMEFYKEVFGEECVNLMFYKAIPWKYKGKGRILERWTSMSSNYQDMQTLLQEIEDLVNDRGRWQGRRDTIIADDAGQIEFYETVFGTDIRNRYLGTIFVAIPKRYKRSVLKNWGVINLRYEDVLRLRQEVEDLVNNKGRWQGRGDTIIADNTGQMEFYIEIFGEEEMKGKHLGCLYVAIPKRYKGRGNILRNWKAIFLRYKDAKRIQDEVEDLVNNRGRWEGRRDIITAGNTGQVMFYEEIFGDKIKGKHLSFLYTAIPIRYRGEGNILSNWRGILLSYKDAKRIQDEIEDLVNNRGRWEGRRDIITADNTGQVRFYEEIFGNKIKRGNLSHLYTAILETYKDRGHILQRWDSIYLYYGDYKRLQEGIEDLVNNRGRWEGRRDVIIADNAGQVRFFEEVFGDKVKEKYLSFLYTAIPERYKGRGHILER